MIKFLHGNLLEAPVEAVVNMVNTVGAMGKGIALMFTRTFRTIFAGTSKRAGGRRSVSGKCS
jgi:O-acetyl-ADP-ribose deacetylase (regulator of RNase III)